MKESLSSFSPRSGEVEEEELFEPLLMRWRRRERDMLRMCLVRECRCCQVLSCLGTRLKTAYLRCCDVCFGEAGGDGSPISCALPLLLNLCRPENSSDLVKGDGETPQDVARSAVVVMMYTLKVRKCME